MPSVGSRLIVGRRRGLMRSTNPDLDRLSMPLLTVPDMKQENVNLQTHCQQQCLAFGLLEQPIEDFAWHAREKREWNYVETPYYDDASTKGLPQLMARKKVVRLSDLGRNVTATESSTTTSLKDVMPRR